ncbi:nuclear transport factor 2 family protein [Sphingomonas canadensis]|uniref:Nuclear transport factor 2 family protein n=1 Tax=Sphingomonas canadensis TaxID=1219257 RepID=A0ABW3HBJ9_9SPHN|nr:nuclear transport factor 2 family protein [Sphingomonas canadensis]MCW3836545.1 nuclear transport factor 2 family protein [Sphingomonas canadensis]
MLDREAILQRIDTAYAARTRGDMAALDAMWADDATYQLIGASMLPRVPAGVSDMHEAVGRLIDIFQFHEAERVTAIVEGLRAALHWRITFSTGAASIANTELCDFWEFTPEGKVRSLVQFTDTALLRILLA